MEYEALRIIANSYPLMVVAVVFIAVVGAAIMTKMKLNDMAKERENNIVVKSSTARAVAKSDA